MKTGYYLKKCQILCKTLNQNSTIQVNLPRIISSIERFEVGSLNRNARKRELIKITVENQAILKRLQE